MSIINITRSTLKSFLHNTSNNHILITNKRGHELVTNIFSAKEILEMSISGICLSDDIISQDKCQDYDVMIFLGDDQNELTQVLTNLVGYPNKLYVYFYTSINNEIITQLSQFDVNHQIRDLAYCPLNFTVIAPNCAAGNLVDLMPILKSYPGYIFSSNKFAEKEAKEIIGKCEDVSALFHAKNEYSTFITLERSYDKLVSMLIPWTYESMLHFYNIKLDGSSMDDYLYERLRYEPYEIAIKEINAEIKKLKEPNKSNVIEVLEYEKNNRIIKKHLSILSKLKEYINSNNIFNRSELEQKALIREIKKNSIDFSLISEPLTNAIYSANEFPFIQEKSIFAQFTPTIRTIMQTYCAKKKMAGIWQNVPKDTSVVYIYVRDYMTYTEVAEVEKFNKTSQIKFHLLSDSILNHWNYLPIHKNDLLYTANHLRISRVTKDFEARRNSIIQKPSNIIDMQKMPNLSNGHNEIEKNINKLQRRLRVTFGAKNDEESIDQIMGQTANLINAEYTKIKSTKPSNKLEENDQKIQIMKLNSMATNFKKVKNDHQILNEPASQFYFKDDEQLLDQMQISSDDEMKLKQKTKDIELITKGISDLHQTFVDLKLLVETQSVMLDQVHMSIIRTEDFVNNVVVQLEKAKVSSKTSKKLMMAIGGIFSSVAIALGIGFGIKGAT